MRRWMAAFAFFLAAAFIADPAPAGETIAASVPARRIETGAVITAADLQPVELAARQLRPDSITRARDLIGLQARRTLLPGRLVSSLAVGQPILVERNKQVAAIYHDGALELSMRVMALDSGMKGDAVRVTNPGNGSVIQAVVSGPGEVTILK